MQCRDTVNERERLWTAAHSIVEGLRPKFGSFMGISLADQAERVIYDNVMDPAKISDAEVAKVMADLKRVVNE